MSELPLKSAVKRLFPDHEVKFNVRKEAGLVISASTNPNKTTYRELDVWIPALKIGFEFQVFFYYISLYKYVLIKFIC